MNLGVGLVERDLEVAVAADEGDTGFAGVVEEDEFVPLARDEATPLHLAVVEEPGALVRGVNPVVEVADDERPSNVAVLEGNQDFVIDLGNPERPAVLTRAQLS